MAAWVGGRPSNPPIPKFYIECLKDKALGLSTQRKMITASPCRKVYSLAASHSPFLSVPEDLAACLVLSYAPWLLDTTPIFGGTKHWLNAYPFLALFAGLGFAALSRPI